MTIVARTAVVWAAAAWAGVSGWWWAPIVGFLGFFARPRLVPPKAASAALLLFVVGGIVGATGAGPPPPLATGPVVLEGSVRTELRSRWDWSAVMATDDGVDVLVVAAAGPPSERTRIVGSSDGRPRQLAGRWVAGSVRVERFEEANAAPLHVRLADRLRARVRIVLNPERSTGRALLVGFLIGDVRGVGPVVEDQMRRAGLSHLVAVSGSNVALFLAGLLALAAPLSVTRTGRLLVILNGLAVFGFLTRWEPSVVRASATAGVVAVARFVGVPLEPVTALAMVAGGAVLLEPALASSLGFRLSVLASAGLIAVAVRGRRGGAAGLVVATLAAQVAVAPLLLAAFGTVPLLSPLANLLAIPVVTAATAIAGTAVLTGAEPLVRVADLGARTVIAIARTAAPWPQVGWLGFGALMVGALVVWRLPGRRGPMAVALAVAVAVALIPHGNRLDQGIAVLDVGQGDAVLVSSDGFTMLVDGGPDPAVLTRRLEEHGVRSIDLAVVTHAHADHTAGLTGIAGEIPIGAMWAALDNHDTPAAHALLIAATTNAIPIRHPSVGDRVVAGPLAVEVLGPRRRYAGINDESVVLLVSLHDTRILLAGDIEAVAQSELTVPGVDILKVPHHGSDTSDVDWLGRHAGGLAVISVGPNDFGHPVPAVIETLESAGADVVRTDTHGDVVITVGEGGWEVEAPP